MTELRIPKLGMAMEEGTLVEWFVGDGDAVNAGDRLYALETDKSVTEIEAPVGGTVRIAGVPDEVYEVGALIGAID